MTTFKSLAFLSILFISSIGFGQSNLNLALSGRLSVGTHFVDLDNSGEERWTTTMGSMLTLEPYLKLRWKNSFALAAGGGIHLYNYGYHQGNYSSVVSYIGLKSEVIFSKYIYTDGYFEYISVGCGGGIAYHGDDVLAKTQDEFQMRSTSFYSRPYFVSPHIGTFARDGRMSYSLAVQFTHFFIDAPYIQTELSSPNSAAKATHKGNYLGLNLIVDYDLQRKRKEKPEPPVKTLPDELVNRDKKLSKEINLNRKRIKVIAWDHGIVDHDTISLMLNNQLILEEHHLDHSKKKVKAKLSKGENELIMVAHNEGSVSPNSAAIIIKIGLKKYKLTLNSTMDESSYIQLNYLSGKHGD